MQGAAERKADETGPFNRYRARDSGPARSNDSKDVPALFYFAGSAAADTAFIQSRDLVAHRCPPRDVPPMMKSLQGALSCLLLSAAFASCAASPVVQGGDFYGPAEGESELTFGGSLGKTSIDFDGGGSSDVTTVDGQLGYGRYLTDEHEVGGQVIMSLAQPDVGDDSGTIGLLPYYRYNIRNGDRSQYYVGGHTGLVSFRGADTETAFSYGIHGGFKSWLTQQLSFFVEPRLTFTSFDGFEIDEFRTLLGFTYSL